MPVFECLNCYSKNYGQLATVECLISAFFLFSMVYRKRIRLWSQNRHPHIPNREVCVLLHPWCANTILLWTVFCTSNIESAMFYRSSEWPDESRVWRDVPGPGLSSQYEKPSEKGIIAGQGSCFRPEDHTAPSSIRKVSVSVGRWARMTTVTWELHYQLTQLQNTINPLPRRTWPGQHKSYGFTTLCITYTQFVFPFHWLWIEGFIFLDAFGHFKN